MFLVSISSICRYSSDPRHAVLANIEETIVQVDSAVAHAVNTFDRPQLRRYDYDNSQLSEYPSYTKLKKEWNVSVMGEIMDGAYGCVEDIKNRYDLPFSSTTSISRSKVARK